jgi:hypothetical protein
LRPVNNDVGKDIKINPSTGCFNKQGINDIKSHKIEMP